MPLYFAITECSLGSSEGLDVAVHHTFLIACTRMVDSHK